MGGNIQLKNQNFARMRDQHSPGGHFQRGGRSCNDCKQSSKTQCLLRKQNDKVYRGKENIRFGMYKIDIYFKQKTRPKYPTVAKDWIFSVLMS